MTPQEVLSAAKQGNPQAIAALINRALRPKGMTAKVKLLDGCLHVMVEGVTVPKQGAIVPYVTQGLQGLGIAAIKSLVIYGRANGENLPAWTEQVSGDQANLVPTVQPSNQPPNSDDSLRAARNKQSAGSNRANMTPTARQSALDKSVKALPTKQRSRQQPLRLAIAGVAALSLLVGAGFLVWLRHGEYQSAESMTYMDRGLHHMDRGQDDQSIAAFTEALKLKPDDALIYGFRGLVYYHQKKYSQAIADFTQVLKFKPNDAGAYSIRGQAYYSQGNYSQAIADFNQALKLEPNDAEVYEWRGQAYDRQGKYSQAIADFNQALKLKPNDAGAYEWRGQVYKHQGNYSQAIADYTQALKLKPDDAVTYSNRGLAYYHQGKYSQAIADYTQALKLKPDNGVTYYNQACAYSLEEKDKEAIASLQRAIQLDGKLRKHAKTSSAFDRIRQDKRFQALVGE